MSGDFLVLQGTFDPAALHRAVAPFTALPDAEPFAHVVLPREQPEWTQYSCQGAQNIPTPEALAKEWELDQSRLRVIAINGADLTLSLRHTCVVGYRGSVKPSVLHRMYKELPDEVASTLTSEQEVLAAWLEGLSFLRNIRPPQYPSSIQSFRLRRPADGTDSLFGEIAPSTDPFESLSHVLDGSNLAGVFLHRARHRIVVRGFGHHRIYEARVESSGHLYTTNRRVAEIVSGHVLPPDEEDHFTHFIGP